MNLEEIFTQLVSYKSITPHHAGCIDFIAGFMKEAGFDVYIQEFGPDKVANLYAVYKPESTSNICFAGHIDVVPPGEGWSSDPFIATKADGKIYGRGAVDMKGAVAAMMLVLVSAKKPGSSLLLTSDEEGNAKYGTKPMLEWMLENGHKIDFAVVGEPTSEDKVCDTIKVGRRGSFHGHLTVHGTQGHVAYPHLANNPINTLVQIANDMINLELDSGVGKFDPSHLEIISIDVGNKVSNLIPSSASLKFNIRYNTNHNYESLKQAVESIIEKYSGSFDLVCSSSAEPFLSKVHAFTGAICSLVESELKYAPKLSTSGGTSDARFIQNYCSVCEIGLKSSMAHKIDEFVEISDLQKLYNVYYKLLEKYHTLAAGKSLSKGCQ